MTKHTDRPGGETTGEVCVLDGQHGCGVTEVTEKVLPIYDATPHIGLRVTVCNAAIERIDDAGDETIELPKQRELRASAAVARCLLPVKLRGWEIKAMRKIMNLTLADLAKKLDERAAPETVSRWESDAQPMGGYAEKVLRLLVCDELRKEAPGVGYADGMISRLKIHDPWRGDASYELPPLVFTLIQLKEQSSGSIIETWNTKMAA